MPGHQRRNGQDAATRAGQAEHRANDRAEDK
jgi:hypothetical protein